MQAVSCSYSQSLNLRRTPRPSSIHVRSGKPARLRPCQSGDGPESEDKDLENAFSQELKRRGMEGTPGAPEVPKQAKDPFTKTRYRAPPPPKAPLDGTEDQRARSQAMVNEGLEGLLPRASQLIQLGGSVFLAFLPFMVVASLLFSGVYVVFGESFLHRGSPNAGPPAYVDPEKLLSESTVDPFVPFERQQ